MSTCPTGFEKFIHIRTIDECMHAGQGQQPSTDTQKSMGNIIQRHKVALHIYIYTRNREDPQTPEWTDKEKKQKKDK